MESKKGNYIYSIIILIAFFVLVGFFGYLVYDLIIKLSEKDFSNNTVIQALITLIITVFLGGYFSKYLERRNAKKIELLKTQRDIALQVVDLASMYLYKSDDENIRHLLLTEESKIKLFFNDEVLSAMNSYLKQEPTKEKYEQLVDSMKKVIK